MCRLLVRAPFLHRLLGVMETNPLRHKQLSTEITMKFLLTTLSYNLLASRNISKLEYTYIGSAD